MKRFNTTENSLLRLRKVTYDDEELLLRWANDPATRASSFETHHISDDEHHLWFAKMMDDPDRIAFILMEDDAPVGRAALTSRERLRRLITALPLTEEAWATGSL